MRRMQIKASLEHGANIEFRHVVSQSKPRTWGKPKKQEMLFGQRCKLADTVELNMFWVRFLRHQTWGVDWDWITLAFEAFRWYVLPPCSGQQKLISRVSNVVTSQRLTSLQVNVNLSLYTPWRCMQEWSCRSTSLLDTGERVFSSTPGREVPVAVA